MKQKLMQTSRSKYSRMRYSRSSVEAVNDLRNAQISWGDVLDWDCCEARVATLVVHRRVDADADISENMSRNRFEIILSHLHFNDNEQRPPDSPIQISQRGIP